MWGISPLFIPSSHSHRGRAGTGEGAVLAQPLSSLQGELHWGGQAVHGPPMGLVAGCGKDEVLVAVRPRAVNHTPECQHPARGQGRTLGSGLLSGCFWLWFHPTRWGTSVGPSAWSGRVKGCATPNSHLCQGSRQAPHWVSQALGPFPQEVGEWVEHTGVVCPGWDADMRLLGPHERHSAVKLSPGHRGHQDWGILGTGGVWRSHLGPTYLMPGAPQV